MSIREISRRTGMARNTVKKYLRSDEPEPAYAKRISSSKLDPYAEKLSTWLAVEVTKSRKQRRNLKQIYTTRHLQVGCQLHTERRGAQDLLGKIETRSRPEWVKAIAGILRPGIGDEKFIKAFKRYLHSRMQRDVQMELHEAYVLCLIDGVDGVISEFIAHSNLT